MAHLEKAFDRTRRIHAGGLWHGLKEPEGESHRGWGYCPLCAKEGVKSPLYVRRRWLPNGGEMPEYWPVEILEREGYRNLEDVRRECGLDSYAFGEGP